MLAGRATELEALRAGVAQLSARRGTVFLLSGEPGIGKTRLANELADYASGLNVGVSWGRCWESGGAPVLWPWHEAFNAFGLEFPGSAGVATGDPAEARFALFRDVARELTRAAASKPLLVVLEDLHAADHSSLLLLEFLATQLRTSPIVVVGTYRDLEASLRPDTADSLARISRTGTTLALGRLRVGDVGAVVREALADADERTIAMVYDTTQGNPLFVTEMVQQLRAGSATTIPLGVREVIRQRLALVAATARRVLEAGAVLGVEFGATELSRMTPDAATEIEAATASGLVTRRGDRVRFVHALYREALYHDLAIPTRRALHLDAARALATTRSPHAEIAHHLIEGGLVAAAEAVEESILAAHQALRAFAFEDAIALLERAKRAVPAGPLEAALRVRVLIALGEARIRAGDATGRELCVEGARIARELGDAKLLAFAGLAYGSVFLIGGVDAVMVGMLEDALDRLPNGDSGLRARTMARLASARQPSAPALRPRDIELAHAAVEMGRRTADRRELLEILQSASGALYGAAHPNLRIQIARQQAQLAEELGDAPRLVAAHVRLAMDHLELGDIAGYAQVTDAYEALTARLGVAAGPWRVPLMRSMLALAADRFDESERWQTTALDIEPDNPRARRARALHRICSLRAAERHQEMRASLGEVRSLWMALPYGAMLADARVASLLARIGDDDEVRALLDQIPAEAFAEEINVLPLGEAVWATADRDQAARLIPVMQRYLTRWMAYWLDVEILELPTERSFAYLLAIQGDRAGCEQHFATALRLVEQLGRRSMIARMKFELGDLYVRLGHGGERARTLIAEARAGAAELGLDELVALIDRRHVAAPPPKSAHRVFTMAREGEYYAITTTRATLRFKATRGMQYLAQLVERAGADIHVLELVGSNENADRGDAGEVVDAQSLRAYRKRVEDLRAVLEDAEARGDSNRAERTRSELDAIAGELARGTGLGGKPRRSESAVDRARSAVQRRIKDALDRVAEQDDELGSWLRRVVHTGNHCSFRGMD